MGTAAELHSSFGVRTNPRKSLGRADAMNRDIVRVLSHYELGALRACWRVPRGYVNEKWVVNTTTRRYVLKRRPPNLRDMDRIRAQHTLIQFLRDRGFPAPDLVPTRDGATFLELDGEVYEIQRYIPGDLCDAGRPTHVAQAARGLGWYHASVARFDHPSLQRAEERYGPRALQRIFDALVKDWDQPADTSLKDHICELRDHVEDLEARYNRFGALPKLVIHGDYYADNLIFREDELVGVVDFDVAHRTWRAMELAEALIYFAVERRRRFHHIVYSGVLNLEAMQRFLRAYAVEAELSADEAQALPHLIRTIWLCAALDPPLQPRLALKAAPQALPEILALAGWARDHATEIAQAGRICRED